MGGGGGWSSWSTRAECCYLPNKNSSSVAVWIPLQVCRASPTVRQCIIEIIKPPNPLCIPSVSPLYPLYTAPTKGVKHHGSSLYTLWASLYNRSYNTRTLEGGHRGHVSPPPLASLTVWQWGVKVKSLFLPRLDTSHHTWSWVDMMKQMVVTYDTEVLHTIKSFSNANNHELFACIFYRPVARPREGAYRFEERESFSTWGYVYKKNTQTPTGLQIVSARQSNPYVIRLLFVCVFVCVCLFESGPLPVGGWGSNVRVCVGVYAFVVLLKLHA